MKEEALAFYRQDCNCCQCILKAFCVKHKKPISQEIFCMCQGINNGFGVGNMCCLLVAGIMVFGILYDETMVKSLRIKLLDAFTDKHRSLNCYALLQEQDGKTGCEELVGEVAMLINELIEK